jgi:GT2 family glycosyltransferase
MKLSVLVTTYGRRSYLEACFGSLASQERTPDELVIVTREGDEETESYVASLMDSYKGPIEIRHARATEPGVLVANRAGFPLVTGEILCFLDDDARARPGWLARIEELFRENPDVGAVGGRDLQHKKEGIQDLPAHRVGRVLWYGRIIGNHHRRLPGVHSVESLKGCNMAFRRRLVKGFDEGIIGNAHFYELDICLGVRRAGCRILYDGDLVVDHYVDAPRFLPGAQSPDDLRRLFFVEHNRVYVMMKNLAVPRQMVFVLYTFVIDALEILRGLRAAPGIGRWAQLRTRLRGKMAGFRSYLHRRREGTSASGNVSA